MRLTVVSLALVVPALLTSCTSGSLCEKEYDCQEELGRNLDDDYPAVCAAIVDGQQNALRKNAEKECEDLANANVALTGCLNTLDCDKLAAFAKGEGDDCEDFKKRVDDALEATDGGATCTGEAAVEEEEEDGGEGEGEAG